MDIEEHIADKIKNPLLTRLNKLPGTTIRLPSKQMFYTNGELDSECSDGEIVVYPMTTMDEIMMRTPDMLMQGTAVESVLKRCCPQIKKPLELLVNDIDYILTQLRKISYGSHIPISFMCDCATTEEEKEKRRVAGELEYNIPVEHFIQNTKELSTKDFSKNFKLTLSNGQKVVLQPIRFSDFLLIQQMNNTELFNDVEYLQDYVATNFTSWTKSVDEIEDKQMIKEWYRELPRFDTEKIKNKFESLGDWGIHFSYTVKCRHCGQEKDVATQLNPVYFFTLPSSQEMTD